MTKLALACAVIVGAGSLITVGYWLGYDAATDHAKAAALTAERAAAKQLADANGRVRAAEQKSALDMTKVSTIYQKGSSDVVETQKSVIAGVRSGAVRLSVATRAAPADPAGTSGACAGRRDGEARSQLSDASAEFLTGLASEADIVALQLNACQVLLAIDRTAINAHQKDADQ